MNRLDTLKKPTLKKNRLSSLANINPKTGKPRKVFEAPTEWLRTKEVPQVLGDIEKQKPIGFIEGVTQDIEQKAPFSPIGALEVADVMLASKRLTKDNYQRPPIFHPAGDIGTARKTGGWIIDPRLSKAPKWTPERQKAQDIRVVNDYFDKLAEREKRGYKTGGKIGAGLSALPAWMIEFAVTGGLKKIGSKAAQEFVEKRVKSKVAKRAAGWAAGATARTVGMPHRAAEQILKQKMKGEKWATSIAKGYGNVWIETASEEAGEAISGRLIGELKSLPFGQKFIGALSRAWTKLSPKNTAAKFWKNISTKAGYSNLIGEVGEERLATILHSIANTEDFGVKSTGNPIVDIPRRLYAGISEDIKNLPVELVVLSVPGATRYALGKIGPGEPPAEPEPIPEHPIGTENIREIIAGQRAREEQFGPDVEELDGQAEEHLRSIREEQTPSTEAIPEPQPSIQPQTPAEGIELPPETAQRPTEAKVEKQPWEMTKQEYFAEIESPRAEELQQLRKQYALSLAGMGAEMASQKSIKRVQQQLDKAEIEFQQIAKGQNHKKLIQKALKEGKPVTHAVLEEYKAEPWAKEALAKAPEGEKITEIKPEQLRENRLGILEADLPPVQEGYVRLYRGQHPNQKDLFHPKADILTQEEIRKIAPRGKGGWFTDSLEYARKYAEAQGKGWQIVYMDIPVEVAKLHAKKGFGGIEPEYFFPELAKEALKAPEAELTKPTEIAPKVTEPTEIAPKVTEHEELTDEELGGITKAERRRLIKGNAAKIEQSDIYQNEVAAMETMASEVGAGYYYIDKGYKGEVEAIIGERKGFPTAIQRMFTFNPNDKRIITLPDGSKAEIGPTPWERAVQEGLGRGKEGVDQTWGEMDISEFVQRVVDSYNAYEKIGGVFKTALERAEESGMPDEQLLAEKQRMLVAGSSDHEINKMITEWAEQWGIALEDIEGEFINEYGTRIRQIKRMEDPDAALEQLAKEQIEREDRQAAAAAAREVLEANDIQAEVEQVEEIYEDEVPFERRGRPVGAAITQGEKEIILLAYGADSETGYHEGYHILRRRLTDKDTRVLDKYFKGDEEAEARAFAEFAKTGKTRTFLKGIWQKLLNVLRKVKSGLQGRGFRTSEDIFGAIQRGTVEQQAAREGVAFERGVFGQPIHEQLWLPLSERQAAIKKVAAQEKILTLFESHGDYVLKASKKDLRALRSNKTAKWLWPVIDELRPEIKAKKPTPKRKVKPFADWLPKGRVPIKEKLIKAVDAEIQRTMKPRSNAVKTTSEEIIKKLARTPGAAELFYQHNWDGALAEVTEAFNQLVKGGPLFDIRYETSGEKFRREAEKNARIKARKARIAAENKIKVKKKPKAPRIKLNIRDVTPLLGKEYQEGAPRYRRKEAPLKIPIKDVTPALTADLALAEKGITMEPSEERPLTTKPTVSTVYDEKWFQANLKKERRSVLDKGSSEAKKAWLGSEKIFSPISTRLYNIAPKLFRATRQFVYNYLTRSTGMIEDVKGFVNATRKMSKEDWRMLDLALKNRIKWKIDELVGKYGLTEQYNDVRDTLDEIFSAAKEVGIDIEYLKDYWPRVLKDPEGFLMYFQGREDWSIIEEAIKRRAKQAGRKVEDLTVDEKAHVINTLLRGFQTQALTLSRPGAAKERTVETVHKEIDAFYADSRSALYRYIKIMNAKIAEREFFGRETKQIQALRKTQSARLTRLLKLKRRVGLKYPSEPKYKEHISKTAQAWKDGQERLERLKARPLSETIGGYVMRLQAAGEISPTQEKEVQDLLRAIFDPKRMGRRMSMAAAGVYIDTLNSPLQAMTQLDEFAYSFYRSPLRSIPVAIRTAARKSKITPMDIGITSIGEEFQGPSLQRALSLLLKSTGFEMVDRLNKENYINTVLSKYQAQARKKQVPGELRKRLARVFGSEYKQVLEDLRKPIKSLDDVTDNVKYLLFNDLLDIQPVAITEMPEYYNRAGNLRILYALKTFYIRRLDFIRNECFKDMKSSKTFARGFGKLVWLAGSFALMGAGTDFLKDFIRGKPFDLEDSIVDNLLRMVFFSKYQAWRTREKGLGTALLEGWRPPTKAIDAVTRDIINEAQGKERGWELWRSVPIGGELYYWWFGEGRRKTEGKKKESPYPS